ncbi:hypothetical protein [Gracilimonas sp. BCB1]|uniref:hypothetical protein n=1 Tax=Gracilimonas sp. BCB1 TaxID=3152362 RepID=UPI0032D93473
MTLPSRLLIKSSLLYLLAGTLLGTLLLINKVFLIHPTIWVLLPIHIELMIFGWVIQFTLGVAYWMLPRYLKGEARDNQLLAYSMVGAFNLGIWLMVFAEVSQTHQSVQQIARALELGAVILFIMLHWKRITSYNKS